MSTRGFKFATWFIALALILGCTPTFISVPAVPTLDADSINRIIAQTAAAASTQTAAAVPTSTPTATFTLTPRATNTPEPTFTETVVFVYNSPTAFVIPTLTRTFSPTSKNDYACEVLDSPPDGTIYSPRLEFKVRWRFKNVGRREWDAESIDFVYDRGNRFHKVAGYDLTKDTKIGEVAEFFVEMQAPKDPGTYTTHWTMTTGDLKFCKVSLTIGVK